ncbi:ribose-5-phosphate isomerase RpiA [Metabacillus sp. RGM 3146]|uniref:ribose-5-phosphate isomerase RpiA n=1 Tax=Metabacillus sp. RGM 3146 TaxID=3401092 RepID=UPI003B9CA228
MNDKQIVGEKAADLVKEGMTVGLGTGSTVFYTIQKLGRLVAEGLNIKGIPTSLATERLAQECGIPLIGFEEMEFLDLAIDGADEADPHMHLIKGGGGALLREKIIAKASKEFVVVADPNKMVRTLGSFSLPVEVVVFGYEMTGRHIQKLGCTLELRKTAGNPLITDNGNYIFDCQFSEIGDPETLERELNMIPGVVENGLFVNMADVIITLDDEKNIKVMKK